MAHSSSAKKSHCENSESESLRQQVFEQLDKNPLFTSKPLCRLLGVSYRTHGKYVANLRTQWKYHRRNERGSKCSIHAWRGWCYLPGALRTSGVRAQGVDVGWLVSRARNRWLLWKDRLGRLQWFETGRVNLYVRKPATLGKAYQLICNGFSFTGLVTDLKVLEEILASVHFKGAHYVFPVGQRLPQLTINLFQKSNGVIIKVGDVTHPDCLEIIATYPDWAERNERLLENLLHSMNGAKLPTCALDCASRNLSYVS